MDVTVIGIIVVAIVGLLFLVKRRQASAKRKTFTSKRDPVASTPVAPKPVPPADAPDTGRPPKIN